MSENHTRRSYLKNAGIVLAGTYTATSTVTAEDEEVESRIRQLLSEANFAEAKSLAEKHGGELSTSKNPLTVNTSSGDISTDNYWASPADSSSYLYVTIESGGWLEADYRVTAGWQFYEDDIFYDAYDTCPKDAAALFWNGNYFVPESSGSSNFYTSDSEVSFGGIETYNGILAEINDPEPSYDGSGGSWVASFATDLNVAQAGASNYPIVMEYKHTYIDTAYTLCGVESISFGLGPASITMSGDPQNWEDGAQNTI